MASHIPPTQNDLTKTSKDNKALVRWADTAERRILKLEQKIAKLESMLEENTKPTRGRPRKSED